MPLQYEPDFQKAIAPLLAAKAKAPKIDMADPLAIRSTMSASFEGLMKMLPDVPEVELEIHHLTSYDGQSVPIHRYSRIDQDTTTPGPVILHIHGGGLIFGSPETFTKWQASLARDSGVQVFSIDYRLAPEHPFPTPVEDCYSALPWLQENAQRFSIDPSRIITLGESAGGNLIAAINLMARDRGLSPPIAKQMLVYPMLDDRTVNPVPALDGLLTWTPDASVTAWSAYLGSDYGTDRVSQYAAPARATSVKGLPPTYMELGTLDIFRDEDLEYLARIAKENIETELHLYPALPHGYDLFVPFGKAAAKANTDRLAAIASV
ncbi:unnamed protein product [Penicillium salamii]|uniref:Alpha/beta hydrolase fold-3 domain-containing protein n=1 Tax=Penicillium salamii TaxID=1612424 RepID=A0A9W4JLW3_9EURO|nr:unnamed protein product [Penicillium salamii]CAG8050250.1 unnamed protein product [Penicillium salamii]CAG8119493.1 unnamed protein product [Penicillium salamii]CAG8255118.1 unnamed protein product [Penicillium salamii]CAG8299525.1 unnamed protein product [Penicillium salamii]